MPCSCSACARPGQRRRRRTARPAGAGSRRSAARSRVARCAAIHVRERRGRLLGRQRRLHPAGDRDVVLGGVPKASDASLFRSARVKPPAAHRGQHAVVAERVDHDRDARVVLRRGAHHRRAADVDLLDALVGARAGGDGLAERVEVDHHQLEGRDAELARAARRARACAGRPAGRRAPAGAGS